MGPAGALHSGARGDMHCAANGIDPSWKVGDLLVGYGTLQKGVDAGGLISTTVVATAAIIGSDEEGRGAEDLVLRPGADIKLPVAVEKRLCLCRRRDIAGLGRAD